MSQFVHNRAYEYFDLGDESDEEKAESSEDEIDIILHGSANQRQRLQQIREKEQQEKLTKSSKSKQSSTPNQLGEQESSSEDEFEKEMNAELEKAIHKLEKSRGDKPAAGQASACTSGITPTAESSKGDGAAAGNLVATKGKPVYDNAYFDSDDDDNYEGEGDDRHLRQHAQPTNDDLLYDPNMDDEDQKWMDRQRQRHHGKRAKGTGNKGQCAPRSDAVLDCPACMTTLCFDCQRHDVYPNQYRAMFVMNCKVKTSELLSVPEQSAGKKRKKGKNTQMECDGASGTGSSTEQNSDSKDKFHPVICKECDTVVGVIDFDEVYHFFNVLTSQS